MRYLLGTLSDEEAALLDARYFSDDGEFEELEIAEEELVDRYVRNELSAEKTRQMKEVLKRHPRLQERVEFARILAKKVLTYEEPVPVLTDEPLPRKDKKKKTPWWGIFWGASAEPAPALRFAFTGSVVLILLATVALLVVWSRLQAESQRLAVEQQRLAVEQQQREQKERDLGILTANRDDLQARLDKAQQENQKNQTQIDELKQQQQQLEKQIQQQLQQQQQRQPQPGQQGFLALYLSPGTGTRGGPARKPSSISRKTHTVQLNLDVGAEEDYDSYNASLHDISAGERYINRWTGLKSIGDGGNKYIRVEVPAKSLTPGIYNVQVEGVTSGKTDPFVPYTFSIAR
ncbi:MAG TPA: hypothetical protein VJT15_22840 [Pyrinomonadaceae bacterium]|nr:hypothetical protein [Pyrinomonadaceae bacterium]